MDQTAPASALRDLGGFGGGMRRLRHQQSGAGKYVLAPVEFARGLAERQHPLVHASAALRHPHFAISTQRVSRITVILIWPGYWRPFSIFSAIFRASTKAWSSLISLGWTSTRKSRPACTA